jgi:hypothetical protein
MPLGALPLTDRAVPSITALPLVRLARGPSTLPIASVMPAGALRTACMVSTIVRPGNAFPTASTIVVREPSPGIMPDSVTFVSSR